MSAYASSVPSTTPEARPIVKWAGGKQQLLDRLLARVPQKFTRYVEPFVGGGALFFALSPRHAVIADANPELINLYHVVANDTAALIKALRRFKTDENSYYRIRAQRPGMLTDVQRAARFMYLNRTCFNGLYRVNKKGEFNVPFGGYANPKLYDAITLSAAAKMSSRAQPFCVTIMSRC